jgi:hypothetical protein
MCSGLFFFAESTVTGVVYLYKLEEFLIPILEEGGPDDTLFQQDGLPPHFNKELKGVFNRKIPEKYIVRGGPITSPPRSPDLTPLDFFVWGYIKDAVYVSSLATTLPELGGTIRDAVATVTLDLLKKSVN